MSEYDWLGAFGEINIPGGNDVELLLSGPAGPALSAASDLYNEDLGSTDDAEWLIRSIGSISFIGVSGGPGEARLPYALFYVPDLRVIEETQFSNLRDEDALGSDQILAHGQIRMTINSSSNITETQVASAHEGVQGAAWDVESPKPADEHSGLMLGITNPSALEFSLQVMHRTLTRG